MRKIVLLFCLLATVSLVSCEKWSLAGGSANNSLTIKVPGQAKRVIPIRSAFVGGGTADPSKGTSHHCRFYEKKYFSGPNWSEVEPLVLINGFRRAGVDYDGRLDQALTFISIFGLNDYLGIPFLTISLEEGVYTGQSDMVKDVRIKSYKTSSIDPTTGKPRSDANVNIVITTTSGATITIKFINDSTPFDGYYG